MRKALIKTDSVADFKNMKETNYKNSQTIVTEARLVPFCLFLLTMFHFAGIFLETATNKGSLHRTIFSKYTELLQLKNIFRIF